jgi:hypothetical protein
MSWRGRHERDRSPAAEPARDSRLARAISEAEGRGPGRARLELLGARIAVAAWMALEAKRDCAWWEWMTRWARAEVALATAAAILALVAGNLTNAWSLEGRSVIAPAGTEAAVPGETSGISRVDSVVTRSLAAGASSDQVMNALVGPASGEWLLTADVLR